MRIRFVHSTNETFPNPSPWPRAKNSKAAQEWDCERPTAPREGEHVVFPTWFCNRPCEVALVQHRLDDQPFDVAVVVTS